MLGDVLRWGMIALVLIAAVIGFLFVTRGTALRRVHWRALREAEVRSVAFRPLRPRNLWVVQNRSHVRGIVIDGCWTSMGTMNFDNRSLALNDEVTLMVLDPDFGRQLEATFQADLCHAVEIDLTTFRACPLLAHAAEWGANRIAPLL